MSKTTSHRPAHVHAQHQVAKRIQHLKISTEASKSGKSGFDVAHENNSEHSSRLRLLRRREVEALTGLSRSTLYDWMKRGEFPQPVKLGARIVAWREGDVIAWMKSHEPRAV